MKTLTKILLAVGITTVIFMIVNIVLFIIFREIPETLVERYFTCVIGECGISGIIQVFKVLTKNKDKDETSEDEDSSEEDSEEDYEEDIEEIS